MDGFVIERMGDENVVRLSDEEMRERGLSVGDRVDVRDPGPERASGRRMTIAEAAEDGMVRYHDALAELAK